MSALTTVTLLVHDYDEAIAWFREALGFELVEDTPLGREKRWVRVAPAGGGTALLLARAADEAQRAAVGRQGGGRVFLFLETAEFDRDHAAMIRRGVVFEETPRRESYGTVAVFRDLYGNRWDLVEPSLRRAPPSPGADETAAARTMLDVLELSEALKRELRHSWLSNGRRESVAEHSWQMALMAMLAAPHLERPVDLGRTLRMIIVHDLVEALCGDVPFFEAGPRKAAKAAAEAAAIEELRDRIGPPVGDEVRGLWLEFEARESDEARLAVAIDNLEVQIQHNLAPFETWEPIEQELVHSKLEAPCGHDRFLRALAAMVKADADAKMRAEGVDVDALRTRLDTC